MDKIAVLIPCYNESATIAKVVKDYRAALPEAAIYVYDNNSTDGTDEIARAVGAVVRYERRQGKGNVIRTMFREIDAECYLMIDGDDTYPAEDARAMADGVLRDGYDMVIGDRLSSTYFTENKRPFHNSGNVIVRKLVNRFFGGHVTDIMTGYRAFSPLFVKSFPILSKGFEIETEMTIHALDKNFALTSIPVGYRDRPALEPVLSYKIELPEGCDVHKMLGNLRILEEEDPMLKIVWNEELGEIHAKLMGAVQIEILKSLIKGRFGVEVEFDTGNIVYKETIQNTVEGVGHFEPLRHYAEVHLKMEPGERGSGIVIGTDCSEDMLDKNWQRLILTHLLEKEHRGVLTGSVITDMKITLTAGRAHLKHTEGGDFRQATYRAVRQGLMQAESVLLEPYYDFQLEVPSGMIGRALTDIQRMNGEAGTPQTEGEMTTIEGYAPVADMRDYQMEVNSYTRGQGHLTCTFRGYEPCQNAEAVIEEIGYDPERDIENPTGSVFCSHGAGFNVSWDKVPEYMHLENQLEKERALEEAKRQSEQAARQMPRAARTPKVYSKAEEKELEEIFIRTYGKVERKGGLTPKTYESEYAKKQLKKEEAMQEYLLVDGYNVIFAWEELKELAKVSIEAARDKLMDILCNYQGYKKCVLILVFDAYKVEGYALEIQKYHNIHVVYTKEAETADQYIEKVVHHIGRKYHVTVVTSDGVEQVITMGQGGTRISSRDFLEEIEYTRKLIEEDNEKQRVSDRNYLFDHADEKFVRKMEKIRLGKNPEE